MYVMESSIKPLDKVFTCIISKNILNNVSLLVIYFDFLYTENV